MTEIRLAIAGMGNCASALVQGLSYYKDADPTDRVPGLMHVELGGYHIRDIELVAAFDVDAQKVGLDASKALFAEINNTIKFADIPHTGVEVHAWPHPRRLRRVLPPGRRGEPRRAGRRRPGAARHQGRRARVLPPRRLRGRPALLRPGLPRRRRGVRERHPGVHRLRPRVGREVPRPRASRSSATTSRARSAPPSCTARCPASSRTAAPRSTTRTS